MPDERFKYGCNHVWLDIFVKFNEFSGVSWCENCGTIKSETGKDYKYYRFPGNLKKPNQFGNIHQPEGE